MGAGGHEGSEYSLGSEGGAQLLTRAVCVPASLLVAQASTGLCVCFCPLPGSWSKVTDPPASASQSDRTSGPGVVAQLCNTSTQDERLKQEDSKFQDSLGSIVSHS